MITYVDASVLLRVIQGSGDALSSWSQIEPISSQLLRVECLRTIDRARLRLGPEDLTTARDRASVLEVLGTFALAPVTDEILERAADPFPTAIGSLDAIHLATALALRQEHPALTLATHDRELAVAARAMGFDVVGA